MEYKQGWLKIINNEGLQIMDLFIIAYVITLAFVQCRASKQQAKFIKMSSIGWSKSSWAGRMWYLVNTCNSVGKFQTSTPALSSGKQTELWKPTMILCRIPNQTYQIFTLWAIDIASSQGQCSVFLFGIMAYITLWGWFFWHSVLKACSMSGWTYIGHCSVISLFIKHHQFVGLIFLHQSFHKLTNK